MISLNRYYAKQLDYIFAYLQTSLEREIYKCIRKWFKVVDADKKDFVLKLHQNIIGKKQAGIFWNQYLTKFLINTVGFKQSSVDSFLFYNGNLM